MSENKLSKEVAEQEFQRFADMMDLDLDLTSMDSEDGKDFTLQKNRIIKAMMNGALVINDEGCPVYTPQFAGGDVNPITFYEPTGAALMAMDRKKAGHDVGKMFASMGEMTKTSTGLFAKMKNRDLRICMAVTTLFLA